ncbi:hypothetical protein D7D52_13825 [Nocardia yunnanensis]|uniref:Low molecular weight antigen MTB12-like C-terminal domain-containing protein n=1 Tax=Nocardia yunnanensis TaxID=2382165 RepID=A0A386ZAA4_9NOCA|nr:hypothetical protein [Nocardia yunnanensis]AYF74762.1 hypothetical protein D7D52_13825 [Nocardia yunnanensis]
MKHTIFRATAALLLTVSALSLTACGKSDDSAKVTTTTSAAAPAGKFQGGTEGDDKQTGQAPAPTTAADLPKPSVADLNDKVTKAFDPAIDAKTKTDWIEDAALDPQLAQKLVDAAKANNVKVTITNVGDPSGGKLKADADVTIDGKPVQNATVSFVADGAEWKIDHNYACSIVKTAKLNSAACQDK